MYRILLVDDEALIREGVSENIQWGKHGYELAGSCENGKEALEFIEKHQVDVVLTDICMPYLDGLQLSEKLGEKYPAIKIIILSGYDDFEYAKRAIRYGVKEYLLKPITAHEMSQVLNELKKEMDKERSAKKQISQMKAAFHKGQQLLYADVLLNLITGSKKEGESRRELREVGVELKSVAFRVAVVELDIHTKGDKLSERVKKESALMAFVLHNVAQEIVKKHAAGEVCQGKDNRTFILFCSNRPAEFRQIVKTVCQEIIDQINRIMGLAVNIGVGSYRKQLKNIFMSHEDAVEALEYRYILGGNHILEIEDIREKRRQADVGEIIEKIILHVKESSSQKLEEDFQALMNVFRENRYNRYSTGRILQKITNRVDEIRRQAKTGEKAEELEKERVLKEILTAGDIVDAGEIVYNYCAETGESVAGCKNPGGRKYVVLATDYIEKNYADHQLNLNSVCSYLNISPSRFSSIFKTVTGTTFLEKLSGIRMGKAKELLEYTDLKNYEIADKVGFNDPHYFSVAFKKITGKSPTEYAKEMRK